MCLLNIRLGAMYWSLGGYKYCCGGRFLLPMSEPELIPRRRWGKYMIPTSPVYLSLSIYTYQIKSTYLAKNNGKELNH